MEERIPARLHTGCEKTQMATSWKCAVPSTSGPFACDSVRDLLLLVDCLGIAAGRITDVYRVSSVYSVFYGSGVGGLGKMMYGIAP